MHIKSLSMTGFRSFVDVTIRFDPRVNIVVGRNGSGKSNLFEAISFVLLPTPCTGPMRSLLLHEGDDLKCDKAIIELRLDNTDRRLNLDSDEVVVRRSIGSKGDSFQLQGKGIRRENWITMMEAAGFSMANPYHIIKQGQVNDLATCSEMKRLDVLRDLSGVATFDLKMEKTRLKLELGDQLVSSVEETIECLNEEIENLQEDEDKMKEFLKVEKKLKELDSVLQTRVSKEATDKIKKLNKEIENNKKEIHEMKSNLVSRQTKLTKVLKELESSRAGHEDLEKKLEMLDESKRREIEKSSRLEQKLLNKRSDLLEKEKSFKEDEKMIHELEEEIQSKEKELESVKQKWMEAKDRDFELSEELRPLTQVLENFYTFRGQQFDSEVDKQKWIADKRREIQASVQAALNKKNELTGLESRKGQKKNLILEQIRKLPDEKEEIARSKRNAELRFSELEKEVTGLKFEKQTMLRNKIRIDSELRQSSEDFVEMRSRVLKNFGAKQNFIGFESIMKVVETMEEPCEVAVVADWLSAVDPSLHLPISVVLGKRLFFMVTKTAEASSRLLRLMREKGLPGQVDFICLEKIVVREPEYPPPDVLNPSDGTPLLEQLDLDQRMEDDDLDWSPDERLRVMKFLLGRVMLMRDSTCFGKLRGLPLDCVTLDGDQGFSRGVLSGGHISAEKVLLARSIDFFSSRIQKEELQSQSEVLDKELNELESQMTKLLQEIERERSKSNRNDPQLAEIRERGQVLAGELCHLESELEAISQQISEIRLELSGLKAQQDSLETFNEEIDSTQECTDLHAKVQGLKQKCKEAFKHKNELEQAKNAMQYFLVNNLYKKLNDLKENCVNEDMLERMRNKLDNIALDLSHSKVILKTVISDLKEVENTREVKENEARKVQDKVDKYSEIIADDQTRFDRKKDEMNKLIAKLNEAMTQKADKVQVDEELLNKYENVGSKELFKMKQKLHKTKENKSKDLNQQAMDQIVEAVEKRTTFVKQKDELNEDRVALEELIENLRAQREEKVNFTYRQFKKYFSEIFSELVPRGKASLEFKFLSNDSSSSSNDNNENDSPIGISIKAKFNENEALADPSHLSGGQKAIVSLAFIFAVQKCDPSPLYVMDEVDAALDETHRAKVANWMGKQKEQFICTTFRKEFLARANHFIGVQFANQVSHARLVTNEEARNFIVQ